MTRGRTFTRAEMDDAARLAAEHGLAIRFGPDGALVMQPAAPGLDNTEQDSAESELARWRAKRGKAAGRAHN